jgi:hypothetical protein
MKNTDNSRHNKDTTEILRSRCANPREKLTQIWHWQTKKDLHCGHTAKQWLKTEIVAVVRTGLSPEVSYLGLIQLAEMNE